MNTNYEISHRESNQGRRGQILVFLGMSMTLLLGLVSLVIDFGVIYYDQNQLNASTQASAMAGAEAMALTGATASSVTSTATLYSSVSGNKNVYSSLSGASMVSGYPSLSCLTTLQTLYNVSCYGPSTSNAITVKQQATVPLFFARLFGLPSVTLTSTATASMRGASATPYNVVMLLDATYSMNSIQSSPDCTTAAISCALAGIQVMLKTLSPCPANQSTCGSATNGNVANSVDRVSLMVFPAVLATTAVNDYNCSGITPTPEPYSTPFLATSTYQIVNFSSDYRTSDTTTTLNPNSSLVEAVGGKSGCAAMSAPGGEGTYYAQAIYKAQAYLAAEKLLYPNSKNVLILLSDGDASATCTLAVAGVCTVGPMFGASTTSGTYPSTLQQCAQAVTAAQAAWAAGTKIYAVNFGAEASGCSTDTSPSIDPCQTMLKMATYPSGGTSTTYFSDDPSSGVDSSCISAARPASTLNQIFTAIAADLSVAKLIPNNTR